MGIKTVSHPPYCPDPALCDFWLFPKLRGCRNETTEEMKEAVTKVIDMLTQEDFPGAFQKLLERYNKCIATGGDYFESALTKKSGNLFNDPRIQCSSTQTHRTQNLEDTSEELKWLLEKSIHITNFD